MRRASMDSPRLRISPEMPPEFAETKATWPNRASAAESAAPPQQNNVWDGGKSAEV